MYSHQGQHYYCHNLTPLNRDCCSCESCLGNRENHSKQLMKDPQKRVVAINLMERANSFLLWIENKVSGTQMDGKRYVGRKSSNLLKMEPFGWTSWWLDHSHQHCSSRMLSLALWELRLTSTTVCWHKQALPPDQEPLTFSISLSLMWPLIQPQKVTSYLCSAKGSSASKQYQTQGNSCGSRNKIEMLETLCFFHTQI